MLLKIIIINLGVGGATYSFHMLSSTTCSMGTLCFAVILYFLVQAIPNLPAAAFPDSRYSDQTRQWTSDTIPVPGLLPLQKSHAQNNQEYRWEKLIIRSRKLLLLEMKDSALSIADQLVRECSRSGNRLFLMKSLIYRSSVHQHNYNYEEALMDLASAAKLMQNVDPPEIRFSIVSNQGLMHYYLENYPIAIEYFRDVYDVFFNQLQANEKCLLYNYLGLTYLNIGDFTEAEDFLRKAENESARVSSPEIKTQTAFNLGKLYFRKGQYANAWNLIMQSLRKFQENNDNNLEEEASRMMGMFYLEQGNYNLAEGYFKQSLQLAQELGNSKIILENYKNIFTTYSLIRSRGNNSKYLLPELEYFKKWAYLNDSLYQTQTTEKILEMEKQYETEKKNNQIKLLEKEKQMAEDQLKSGQIQRRYLFFLVVLILAVLGFFIYSFFYYRRMTYILQRQSRRIMRQQAQISRQNEQLQAAFSDQNKLFSIIAHDLRSPLVSLSNIARLINIYIGNKRYSDAAELSRQMDLKNDHLLELTDNLLSWTRSHSENFRPVLEKVRLEEMIHNCLKIYQSVSLDKEIILSYEAGNGCDVLADRNMLQTILRNLINNAIKFTPRGGRVRIFCEQDSRFARITVRDTGIGISPGKMNGIFEIDVKKIQNGTEGEKSSGLGLSVCKEFTEIMGGIIYAESRENTGTSFIFTVPLFTPLIQAQVSQTASSGHRPWH